MITKPTTKFALVDTQGVVVDGATEIDVTNDVGSWKELEIEQCREDTTGVISEVSFPITFHFKAADLLRQLFQKNKMFAEALFRIYKRADYSDDYTLIKEMRLDFSTYKADRNGVEIESINDDLAEYISSQKSTKFDIPVNELKPESWDYKKLQLLNNGSFTLPDKSGDDDDQSLESELDMGSLSNEAFRSFTINKNEAEMDPGGGEDIFQSQKSEVVPFQNLTEIPFFFEADKKINNLTLNLDVLFESNRESARIVLIYAQPFTDRPQQGDTVKWKYNLVITKFWGINTLSEDGNYTVHVQEKVNISDFRPGSRLMLAAQTSMPYYSDTKVWTEKCTTFEVTYFPNVEGYTSFGIPVIRPEVLLQELLDRITEQDKTDRKYTGTIDWGNLYPASPMICAAESIRGFEEAKLHTSMSDFTEWIRTLGYEFGIEGRKLTDKPRANFFEAKTVALELAADEVADLYIEAADDFAYTNVKIGYDKQDYESVNGRFESNGTFEYTTGFKRREEKTLKLISPYRADTIGIELLTWERGKRTTDDQSDNDVFFMALTLHDGRYQTYSDTVLKEEGMEMYNAIYHPYRLVQVNKTLLGISTSNLRFASTNVSGHTQISTGENLYSDVELTKRLFEPISLELATGHFKDLPGPVKWNGVIKFEFEGVPYIGFINKIMKNYSLETETTWTLWMVEQE